MAPARSQHPAVRRWCARAAVVLGGAVAGSAAAWLLSSGSAVAAQDDDPMREAAKHVQKLRDSADRVRSTVDRVTESLHTDDKPHPDRPNAQQPDENPPAEPRDDVDEAVDHNLPGLTDISSLLDGFLGDYRPPQPPEGPACAPEFQDFCDRVEEWFTPPADLVPPLPTDPGPDAGHDLPGTMPAQAPADATELAPNTVAGTLGHLAESAIDVASSGVSERGHPQHNAGLPAYGIPQHLPAMGVPGTGTAAAGHADGAPWAITAASAASAATGALAASTGALGAPLTPGGQPGVTPD